MRALFLVLAEISQKHGYGKIETEWTIEMLSLIEWSKEHRQTKCCRTYLNKSPTTYHRLNGSSSPVLTAICLSYGSLCDFLYISPNRAGTGSHIPRPILTQNGSNDVGSSMDVAFGVKIATFKNP